MQQRPPEPYGQPTFDVRILEDTGRWQQRSAVFADAGVLDALVWAVEAAAATAVGNAAWNGMRGIALSRQRGGKPAPRLAAHAVARRYIEEKFGDVVQPVPYQEEVNNENGSWRLHFESESGGRQYVVRLKNVQKLGRKRDPQVAEARRTNVRKDDPEDRS